LSSIYAKRNGGNYDGFFYDGHHGQRSISLRCITWRQIRWLVTNCPTGHAGHTN